MARLEGITRELAVRAGAVVPDGEIIATLNPLFGGGRDSAPT
jgi:hypothetical protein